MKSPDEVPVHHLVADSGAFILNANLVDLGSKIYTVRDVIAEIRDKATRERMQFLPFELDIREPSPESMKIVTDASKKTGDFVSLSVTDLKVIALTHDLHVEHCGRETLNYNVKSVVETIDDRVKSKEILSKIPPGFHQSQKKPGTDDAEADESDSSDEDGDEDWIGEDNFEEAVQKIEDHSTPLKDKMLVACVSTDFAVQNVLLHMKMDIVSINGMQIKTLKTYILRCRCCYKTTPIMTKQFCPKCGNKALHRVAVTVNEDGVMQLHIDWERLRVKRGLKHSIKMPKGGNHDDFEQIVEDQRMPQNRMARVHQDPVSDSPFLLNDVTSRSALLGLRSHGHRTERNPNVQAKKRTGKKKK